MNKLKKILALLMVAAFALMSVAFANDTENEENRVQPRSSEYFRSYSGSIVAKGNGKFKKLALLFAMRTGKKTDNTRNAGILRRQGLHGKGPRRNN